MDEVSFGPGRATRLPSRRPRALAVAVAVAVSAAGVVAGTAYALTAKSAQHAETAPPAVTRSAAALPDPGQFLPPAGCRPVQPDWPSLAGLPAGMRPGALPVIVGAQFSGRCPAP